MGKSAPKISDPLKSLQGFFPGLQTSAFSLQRAQPASTSRTGGGGGRAVRIFGQGDFGTGGRGNESPFSAPRNFAPAARTTSPASGPFVLRRTDNFVPEQERRLFGLLGENLQGFGSILDRIRDTRGQLGTAEGRVPGLFENTAALRGDLSQLAGEVRPGFGRLTEAAVNTIRNRFSESVGNLREALGKRNLQGSSFAINETRRVELDFAQEEERARSEAFIQEVDLRRQIVADSGKLIELDQQSLQVQAQQIGLQLGLNEQEAGVFRDQLINIQSQGQLLAQRITRELQELGIAGNIINQQQAIVADLAKAQAQLTAQAAADQGALFGSILGTAAGAFGPALLGFTSDRRLKRDIFKVGRLEGGLNLYAFRYLWSAVRHIGVMADEVLRVKPEAVFVMSNGYYAVDYSRL